MNITAAELSSRDNIAEVVDRTILAMFFNFIDAKPEPTPEQQSDFIAGVFAAAVKMLVACSSTKDIKILRSVIDESVMTFLVQALADEDLPQ